ncbi:MAG: TSUP family transporter [Candidatus Omnitrophica bacterium]|nr:TSUP family transporter [Candidatus Omnitrophota bacterium]
MEYFIICIVAFIASSLTLFSGLGLGIILTPVFAVFFPVPVAVGATAIVHLANNLFKIFLVGKSANKKIIMAFGIPAVIAAFVGAYFGKVLLKKVTLRMIQVLVGVMLVVLGVALSAGLI